MRDFRDKGAVVTGAASGIGRAVATAFAREGMMVALLDIEPVPLEHVRREIETAGGKAIAIAVDVSEPAAMSQAAARIATSFGRLHVAVNNAGVAYHGTPVQEASARDWEWILGVNVLGVVNGIRAFLPLIRSHGEEGHVVNTASVAAIRVWPGLHHGVYAASKHAVLAITQALELELAGTPIGVSALCPGVVSTNLHLSSTHRPDRFGAVAPDPAEPMLRDMMAIGMAPDRVAARLLQAIRDREMYIFTHAAVRSGIAEHHQRLMQALDRAAELEAGA